MNKVVQSECPYCEPPFGEFTDDHIFPQFMGGRAAIRICRNCNSYFGHSFEAETAKQIKQLQVFISHFGLNLTRNSAIWPSALEVGGKTYNLKSGMSGVQYELAHPVIRRDDSGNIIGGQARSRSEARQQARGLIAKGKAKHIEITESVGETFHDIKLNINMSFGPSLYRFATKIVANTLIYRGRENLIRNSGISEYLHGKGEWGTCAGYCDTSGVRKLRPALSHMVYVEFGVPTHAIVVIFGNLQVYVPLPAAPPGAILGFLDPITGEESFTDIMPIGFAPPPQFVTKQEAESCLTEMLKWLGEEGKARGATSPPNLTLGDFDLGSPTPSLQWVDGTHRFMKTIP